jgi:hypothetical protein
MDTDARRKGLRHTFKENLAEAYTDEEASPPEWVDLVEATRTETARIRDEVRRQTEVFVNEADIRKALVGRDRAHSVLQERIGKLNEKIRRLNLIAPNARFNRGTLDVEEVLSPLFRTQRKPAG